MKKAYISVGVWVAVQDEQTAGVIAAEMREATERATAAHYVYDNSAKSATLVEEESAFSRATRENDQAEAARG